MHMCSRRWKAALSRHFQVLEGRIVTAFCENVNFPSTVRCDEIRTSSSHMHQPHSLGLFSSLQAAKVQEQRGMTAFVVVAQRCCCDPIRSFCRAICFSRAPPFFLESSVSRWAASVGRSAVESRSAPCMHTTVPDSFRIRGSVRQIAAASEARHLGLYALATAFSVGAYKGKGGAFCTQANAGPAGP